MHPAVISTDILCTDIGIFIQTVAHDLLGDLRHDVIDVRIIRAQHGHTIEGQTLEEVHEGLLQLTEIVPIGFHMIGIDVRHHGDHRRQAQERRIGLIGFGHQKITLAEARIGTRRIKPATNHKGGVKAALTQNRSNQTGRRRFTVRTGNRDTLLQPHQLGQHLGARHDRNTRLTGGDHFRVICLYGG